MTLKAPYPYFGGKSRIAKMVWQRFGAVKNFVDPFFGSNSILLAQPADPNRMETINDKDGFVSNFWRAVQAEPDVVAAFADHPVNENDLHARHIWLVQQSAALRARLEGDPHYYDPKIAGYWVWGICCWIGSEWCAGTGAWRITHDAEGLPILAINPDEKPESGVHRQLVHVGRSQGVHRQNIHLKSSQGVHRKRVSLNNAGRGVHKPGVVSHEDTTIYEWFDALQARLRRVRVCSGDWSRVCGPTPTVQQGLTGVFLDPPYASEADRDPSLYTTDSLSVAHEVRTWAVQWGDDPRMRIALCGYEGEHDMPASWDCVPWKAHGGYGSQRKDGNNENAARERVWFSPHCIPASAVDAESGLMSVFG